MPLTFAAAGGADTTVDVGDLTLSVPPYPLAESVTWCAEIDRDRQAAFERNAAASFADPAEKFHYLNGYSPRPADIFDVQALASDTPAGIVRVVAYCLPAARVVKRAGVPCPAEPPPPGLVDGLLRGTPAAALSPLARVLVGLPEQRQAVKPPAAAKDDKGEKDERADPLPGPGSTPKTSGSGPQTTGPASSPPSTQPSASTPADVAASASS